MILYEPDAPNAMPAPWANALQTVYNNDGWCPRQDAPLGMREILCIGFAGAVALTALKHYARQYFGLPAGRDRFVAELPPDDAPVMPRGRRNALVARNAEVIDVFRRRLGEQLLSREELQEWRGNMFVAGTLRGYRDGVAGHPDDPSAERASVDLGRLASHAAAVELRGHWAGGYRQGYERGQMDR